MSKPIVAVTGATGQQGGSVVRFLLQDGEFHVRAMTRDVESDAAKALKAKGVEVVKADFNDRESLEAAFEGAYGVFVNTDFWQPGVYTEESEFLQGKRLVDVAKEKGVKHFVYSTIEEWNNPPCEHCNSKYRTNNYLIESGLPRTSIYTALYYENFTNMKPIFEVFRIKHNPDSPGAYIACWSVLWTDGLCPAYSVADTGAYVLGALKNPAQWIGRDIKIATEIFTPREFADIIREVSGKTVELRETSYETFDANRNGDLFLREFHANMELCYKTGGLLGRTDEEIEEAKKLFPEATSLRKWTEENIDKLIPQ